ncbi:oxoisovalerate dehydrogenase subunit alpha, mitochondrial [Seminavis robusta]|uniref:2-oxoisovalerate dehydrogenase subunit alpha n=1 Tax=Seminavis robusta TaxID=568900 RepID=A0A9N8HXB6_9STRA|nr:oxoisovalerate dehydrogenase subunit alpha, mitochondrial [Seminavis robusta]|eukprot:Sro2172_g317530.1 oxoisovalerate dehydrogenase subunit alpha, mitochondrial (535) ;mRNA; f:7113-9019
MKPSLQYPQRFGRILLCQARPRRAMAIRSFASVMRPKAEEEHAATSPMIRVPEEKSTIAAKTPTVSIDLHLASNDNTTEAAVFESPSEIQYAGNATMPLTSVLHIVKPSEDAPRGVWPVFRLMDENGRFRDPAFDAAVKDMKEVTTAPPSTGEAAKDLTGLRAKLQQQYPFHAKEFEACTLLQESKHPYPDTDSKNTLLRAHQQIVRLREMDTIFQNAQRQGRISFYMTCRGEEAIHFGSASALDPADTIFAQYREAGPLMWRGFTLEQFANQCFSNDGDLGKGRQMPVHYGCRALNYQTISSPLGTQIPQAVGAAYHYKLQGKPNVTVCYFGDGAASTTDFHSAFNFAATLKTPVLFFCRNNGFAISTPVAEQYAGDGIIARAPGYGMAAIRVDGNDIFAVHAAVREARAYALEHSAPVLIEAMTYRLGHHSTSDDSSSYRDKDEVSSCEHRFDPLGRFDNFLKEQGWMDDAALSALRDDEKRAVLKAMNDAEQRPPPPFKELFSDVYKEIPPHLKRQQAQLETHMKKYKGKY